VAPSRRSHEVQVEYRRIDATDCVGPYYPYFIVFIILGFRGILIFLVFCLGAPCHFSCHHFEFLSLKLVCHELFLFSIIKRMRESDDLRISDVNLCLKFNKKFIFAS
jgi:hypothetical protein